MLDIRQRAFLVTNKSWHHKSFTSIIYIYRQSVLPKSRSFTVNSGTKITVLSRGRSSTENPGTKVAVLLGMNRCGSLPLLSKPHSLFNIWTDLKRSEKIPGAPTWRWGEWIWLTVPFGLQRNTPQGLNISFIRVFDQIRDPEIPGIYIYIYIYIYSFRKFLLQTSKACWGDWVDNFLNRNRCPETYSLRAAGTRSSN